MRFGWLDTVLGPLLLSILVPAYAWDLGLDFLAEPTSMFAVPGQRKVAFRCAATPPTAVIEWLQDGETLIDDAISGMHILHNKLVVKLPKEDEESGPGRPDEQLVHPGGLYLQCLARYKGRALISQPARLIYAELASFQPQKDVYLSVIAGNSAVIPCTPPYSVPNALTEFEFNGTRITKTKDRYLLIPSGNLHITNVNLQDSGVYRCTAYNPFLNESTAAHHRVFLQVKDPGNPVDISLTIYPPSVTTAVKGSNVTLECAANGFPIPNITWVKQDGHLSYWRHAIQGGNLQLFGVCMDDEGTYVCQADNKQSNPPLAATILEVQETPQITTPPHNKRVHEGESVTMECVARGHPKPVLTWYHNGKRVVETGHVIIRETKLVMHRVTPRHSGIYQCFASSELGAIYAASVLTVISESSHSSSPWNGDKHHHSGNVINSSISLLAENNPTRHPSHKISPGFGLDYDGKKKRKKKKHKGVKLVLPMRPAVSRLTENSVMVRWDVPQNDGLPILFFKVQYREASRKGGIWMTIDDDIAAHIHSYAVTGLKSGAAYRFRIAAVYSNYDNQRSPNSAKFLLYKDPPMKKPVAGPVIIHAEAASPSAITLRWDYVDVDSVAIEGFFIHYRATHSAGDYLKVAALGAITRSHIISHLLPDTSYDVKMQCFNIAGTSDFSNIRTCKTLPSEELDQHGQGAKSRQENESDDVVPVLDTSKTSDNGKILYIVLGIVLGVLVLVFSISLILCLLRQKQHRRDEVAPSESQPKPGNGHIPERNGFLSRAKVNISINPLSEIDGDKTQEGTYPLMLRYEVPSNNNEVILLTPLDRGNMRSNDENELDSTEQIFTSGASREEEV